MPKVHTYVDISTLDKEAKKDFIDRHSPFVYVEGEAVKGEKLKVKVKVGKEFIQTILTTTLLTFNYGMEILY